MDLAGGDLTHATDEIEKDVEQDLQVDPPEDVEKIEPAGKTEHGAASSGSSSSEDVDLQKSDSHIIKVGDVKIGEDALAHLPEHERAILRTQLHIPETSINYFTLYRYATRNDLIIIAIGSFCAIAGGALQPLMTVIFGQLTGYFTGIFQGTISSDEFRAALRKYTLYFVYLAIGEFVTIYTATTAFLYTGEHITQKVREHYLAAILRQNIAFFDKLGAGEMTTRITADTNLVQDGLSQKVSLTMAALATFVAAFVIAFINSWKLTLVLMSTVVAITLTMGLGSSFIIKFNKASLEAYGLGGTVAEEVLSSIRNATAFNTQDKLAQQYETYLANARKAGIKLKTVLAIMIATMMLVLYLNYGLSFWQGSRFVVTGDVNVANVITIMLAVMIAAFSLGNVAPHAQAFATSIGAGAKIFATIDRVSAIDPTADGGTVLEEVRGVIELKHIKHIYPSRAEVVVMEDVSLVIPAGKTTALVGASGSGKSTIVGLIERWYDPVGGSVTLDGHDLTSLNVRWLRHQISLVSQEPTLFGTSIRANIAHGLIGTAFETVDEATQTRMVEDAAKMANAHDFITTLPEGYETNVGERGFLLSGGQKQRIAIARAVVSDPKILLLDEATSALDTKSEGVVQAALDVAARGRTSIVIAHRLSTIKTADNIVVMSHGRIVEQGTHDQLLERQGVYASLVEAQRISADRDDDDDDDDAAAITKLPSPPAVDPDDANIQSKLNRTQTAQSQSSLALPKRSTEAKGVQYSTWTLIRFIATFNRSELLLMLVGVGFSIISGGGYPVQSIFFAHAITALSYLPNQYDQLRHDANFWSSMYLMLALVLFVAYASQGWAFAICSERLIYRARNQAFRTMLRQDIAFFDQEANSAGALTSFLATETTYLAGISGSTLGTLLSVLTTLVAAIVLSCAVGWKLALVCTATIPILLFCGYLRFWILARFEAQAKKNYESSASYACEATSAIRTVSSLTREHDVWNHYHDALVRQGTVSLHSVLRSSALYAASQALAFLCIALGFWYGGTLVANHEYNLTQLFICLTAIIFGAQSAGTFFSFAPDMGKARSAAQNLKTLFDRQPAIDSWSPDGQRVQHLEGLIEFRDVHFRYPTRPEQPVLRGLNLTVKPGQYVALVGASGCGKSTTIALLERFYDPLVGSIFADGIEISSMNLKDYRGFLALVSQEPTLYQGSIRENVLLGSDRDDVSDEAIVQACKDANIYDFIMSLPDGFSTIVGSKGSMLSGGQKQRVAIARALLRNPTVLLLDEATSALDSESEKVVQDALDHAARGRTTIAVAHRLSTIQKADMIYVIDQGRIVEEGTHVELLRKKGKYFELVHLQSLERTG